ncbi:MAG: hypothetical protein E8D40_12035 [Nitrospira sp.]|nr:MAG: hypothetical protein E8D40_12035 [Nitrospira sp.]
MGEYLVGIDTHTREALLQFFTHKRRELVWVKKALPPHNRVAEGQKSDRLEHDAGGPEGLTAIEEFKRRCFTVWISNEAGRRTTPSLDFGHVGVDDLHGDAHPAKPGAHEARPEASALNLNHAARPYTYGLDAPITRVDLKHPVAAAAEMGIPSDPDFVPSRRDGSSTELDQLIRNKLGLAGDAVENDGIRRPEAPATDLDPGGRVGLGIGRRADLVDDRTRRQVIDEPRQLGRHRARQIKQAEEVGGRAQGMMERNASARTNIRAEDVRGFRKAREVAA